ncbi:MAG: M28 family peptidase [Muribaculaceae bacterium]|nr:M28 family peptidase [Muribaculaceae bacterium]
MTILSMVMTIMLAFPSCSNSDGASKSSVADNTAVKNVEFVADSAMAFLKAQCDLGPRVPGTSAHAACAKLITSRLTACCDTVQIHAVPVTTFDGEKLTANNIMGRINPGASTRILLLAHWDCRPWADKDSDPALQRQPVMGANDAASGAAILLELARIMGCNKPEIGVDLLFVDAEDWGDYDNEDSWALGTQAWARDYHSLLGMDYAPIFGILLDMVGAHGARFAPEYFSTQNAASVVKLVWDTAREAGYGAYFVSTAGGAVTDDHVVVNNAGIPCIDIIDMRGEGFFDGWHTTHDTLDAIDAATLKAVGQTLSRLIYNF